MIVCNGYKDEEFMRLALMGQKLGHQVFIVIEQLSEIDVLLQVADEMDVTPTAGVRIKLASRGFGRWAESGGEKSKFGLNSAQLMQAIDKLRAAAASTSSSSSTSISDRRSPTSASSSAACRRSRGSTSSCATLGRRHHARGRRRRPRRRLRRHQLDRQRQRELLAAGVRERRRLHARRSLPRARAADAAPHQRIGARAHRAPRAAAAQGDRRRVAGRAAVPELTDDDHALLHEMVGRPHDASRKNVSRRARARDLPRRHVRQGARAGSSSTAACSRSASARWPRQIYFATINRIARLVRQQSRRLRGHHRPTSRRRSSTATSATSRCSSRCPTAGRSISSSRSCRSTGWTRSRSARHDPGRDLRLRRQDRPLRRRKDGRAEPGAARVPRRRATTSSAIFLTGAYQEILGDLHNLFGDTNAVHIRLDRAGLRGHRPRARRHRDRGAELRAVPRVRSAARRSGARSAAPSTSRARRPTRSSPSTWPGSRATRISRARRRSSYQLPF